MGPTTTLADIAGWPPEDRLKVAFRIWDEVLASGWRPGPDAELDAELDRRLAEHEANPADVRTWDQIMARLGKRA